MNMLTQGPLKKSIHTKKLEMFVKCILHNPNAIHYHCDRSKSLKRPILYAQMGLDRIDISSMVQKANYNHLFFSHQDSEDYHQKIFSWGADELRACANYEKYLDLTQAEKLAIYRYSDCFYETINKFMYNEMGVFNRITREYRPERVDMKVHDIIVNLSLLASGLNKVTPECTADSVFRGEAVGPEILHQRISKIKRKELDNIPAFMSTSSHKKIADLFSGVSLIELENGAVKDIAGLSKHRGEEEFLLNPNYILWESFNHTKGIYFFKGQVAAPVIAEPQVTPAEMDEFESLRRFLKK